jgi:predicted ABC-type sugar transport system permease subunit
MIKKKANLIFLSVITVINVLLATGYSVAGPIDPSSIMPATSVITDSTIIFAMYAAAGTIPLALLAIWAVVKRTRQELFILGIKLVTDKFLSPENQLIF